MFGRDAQIAAATEAERETANIFPAIAITETRAMTPSTRLAAAIERISFARHFTSQRIAGLSDVEWFWSPSELTTHVAWQVGHLAVAQYNLCLRRVRGRTAEDETLISDRFIDFFKQGSQPNPEPAANLALDEIRCVFEAVLRQALVELATRSDAELDVPLEQPHPVFQTKLAAIEYCPLHEFVHAGQIALLRRMMGKPPLR